MIPDFSSEYGKLTDDELLQIATDRAALMDEAATALDAELRRRNLTASDQAKYARSVEHKQRRESRRRLRKVFGSRRDMESWGDMLLLLWWSALVMALIGFAYQALPARYHFTPDRQEAAFNVMFSAVSIGVGCALWWRKLHAFFSLIISSALHFFLVDDWISRGHKLAGPGHAAEGRLALLLGFLLFFMVYGCISGLRKLGGDDTRPSED